MSSPLVTLESAAGVGVIRISHPPVNAFAQPVRAALLEAIERAGADPAITAVVVTGAAGVFVAGADIREFDAPPRAPVLVDVLARLEALDKPVVAWIDGYALGGGLELAMACHHRIASPRARLGLPEVRLGLLPGAGGTQRLPRLVGPELALDLMLSGRSLEAGRALEVGLVDEILSPATEGIPEAVRQRAAQLAGSGAPPRRTGALPRPAALGATEEQALLKRHADMLLGISSGPKLVECLRVAATRSFDDGVAFARAAFEECRESRGSRALRHLFFAERAAAHVEARPRRLARIGLLGSGSLAASLAVELQAAGLETLRLEPADPRARGVDVLVEALEADAGEIATAFAALQATLPSQAVLALTAPRLRPDRLAIDLGRQESVVGFLPIGPAGGEGAAEIAAVDKTARDAVATVVALARRLGRQPVQVAGATGIAAARLQAALPDGPHALEREGRSLLAAGVTRSANDIDVLCVHGLRLPRHEGGPMWMAAERRRSVSPELLQ